MWLDLLVGGIAVGLFVVTAWRPRHMLYIFPTIIIFSPEFALTQVGPQAVFITFADVVSFGLVLAVIREREVQLRTVWLVGGGFVAVAAVSSVVGVATGTVSSLPLSVFYLSKFVQYLFVGLALSVVTTGERDFRRVVAGLSVAMLLGLVTFPVQVQQYRFAFPFTGIQETAVIAAMVVVLFVSLLVDSSYHTPGAHAVLLFVVVTAGLLFILASAGRAGVLGLAAGAAYVVYRQRELSLRRVVPVLCGLALFVLPLVFMLETPAMRRLEGSIRIVTTLNFEDAGSLKARLEKWGGALQLWAQSPVLGVGLPIGGWEWLDGWYVRVLAETGLVGLATWSWFMGDTYRHVGSATQGRAQTTGVVGVLIVMCVASVFGERFLTINTALVFWVIVGTGLSTNYNPS